MDTLRIKPGNIYSHLPHYVMRSWGACGAAAVRTLGAYWGVGPKNESDWKTLLNTGPNRGTLPKDIINTLKDLSLSVKVKEGMELEDLFNYVKNNPVLIPMQAWGKRRYYRDTWSGHWLIVIGFDEQNVYFEDSYVAGARTYVAHSKFLNRWHDTDWNGKYWLRTGIVVGGWEPKKTRKLFKAFELW